MYCDYWQKLFVILIIAMRKITERRCENRWEMGKSVKLNVLGSCVSRVSLLKGERDGHGVYGDKADFGYFLDK